MTSRLLNELYLEDLDEVIRCGFIDWTIIDGRQIAVSGATGTIGTFLVDLLMRARIAGIECQVIAIGRNETYASLRLPYFNTDSFSFVQTDISARSGIPHIGADLFFHLASTTHPRAYATQPIGTVLSNIIGLTNLLDQTPARDDISMVFASSVEVYGENRGDTDKFDESYCGYIDCNTLRAGYPESKRAGEALCQAYSTERGIGVSIPRLPRVYGPTMPKADSKAISQFIRSAVAGDDIVLKSSGSQLYSYGYISDVVAGILTCATRGGRGEAYNVCGEGSDITLRDLAAHLASIGGVSMKYELPDVIESAGYSKSTKALLNGDKIFELGYRPRYDVVNGLSRTISILKSIDSY